MAKKHVVNLPGFFDQASDSSQVKAEIVAKYFYSWAKIILKNAESIQYIDLFSGPGRYEDGTSSTPIKVMERALTNAPICEHLTSIFNDADAGSMTKLRDEIASLPGIERLKKPPQFSSLVVGEEIAGQLQKLRLAPTLLFVDPWGYKALSFELINAVIKDRGCEAIFFFNYNRVNMATGNDVFREIIDNLFTKDRAQTLRKQLEGSAPHERETLIMGAVESLLQEKYGKYVLSFRFKADDGKKVMQHLVFVSKHPLGYSLMKDIMAGYCTESVEEVPKYEYNPLTVRRGYKEPDLFYHPIKDLKEDLLKQFAGKTMTRKEVFEEHHIGRPYIEKNYYTALLQLEKEGIVTCEPPTTARPKRHGSPTLANHILITFPDG